MMCPTTSVTCSKHNAVTDERRGDWRKRGDSNVRMIVFWQFSGEEVGRGQLPLHTQSPNIPLPFADHIHPRFTIHPNIHHFVEHIHNPPLIPKRGEATCCSVEDGQRVNRHYRQLRRAADNDDQSKHFCELP
ncbi:hypothetical protein BLNAU_4832 [Blattamonas nauphoetae]|uniref:Uncharacterized protein n=1 Tax=Blattamonas nauphoetae TaxID=2049346 RepID=A0ABQ9Y999_9EUKA|nr:hypothetical protein BLNAU_4832 [Blattamonas nauphoetae]